MFFNAETKDVYFFYLLLLLADIRFVYFAEFYNFCI